MAYTQLNDSFEYDYTPGYTKYTHEYGTEFGDEFHAPAVVELLASMVAYKQRGVTLAGGNGVLPTGTVLAKKAADGKYYPWTMSGSGGLNVALGVLRNGRDTGGTSSPAGKPSTDCQGNLVYGGTLNLSVLSGGDNITGTLQTGAAGGFGSNAVSQLGGRVLTFGNGVGTPPFAGSAMDNGNVAVFIF